MEVGMQSMSESRSSNRSLPLRARLYDSSSAEGLDLSEIAGYLKDKDLFSEVLARKSFLEKYGKPLENTAAKLAETRVRNLETPKRDFEISSADVEFERKLIENFEGGMTSVLYDGFRLEKAMTDLLPEEERGDSYLHVIFTDRFFGTWKPETQRYHARVSVYGFPSIISTTGIVDAPARPEGFYRIERGGKPEDFGGFKVIGKREKFRGKFVDYDDERLTEIMKGYAMQAAFYHLFTDPFCEDKECRLYNPHLQKNILRAQLTDSEFCDRHREILEKLQRKALE